MAGEQLAIGKGSGLAVGVGEDEQLESLGKLGMQPRRLRNAGFHAVRDAFLDQILVWKVAIVDLLTIFLAWCFAFLLTRIPERQGGSRTQLGDQLQTPR